jgi:hypothetical protein
MNCEQCNHSKEMHLFKIGRCTQTNCHCECFTRVKKNDKTNK